MSKVTVKLTVFFQQPFWIGLFERIEGEKLSVCKVTFGEQPKEQEVWEFILKKYHHLQFSDWVETAIRKESTNPKRIQRQIKKQMMAVGIGTKSQQALQAQREQWKAQGKANQAEKKRQKQQRIHALKQQKRKEKRKGR